ncbi:claudin-8-like [Dendropsophus ebraccatus]|uniref:claudin-8-like n=1 Tax=Dendropsophus ebraccatus TaxID=150705 RepID=UPI003831CDAE
MAWFLVQIIGILFGGLGMVLTFVITIMPQWRVSILAENNGINGRIDGYWISRWDGLWTTCVNQARLAMQCNSYESQVSLTMDLKSGRILLSFAILMTLFAFAFSVVGFLFHKCHEEGRVTRQCLRMTAGIIYILSTILIAIPVIWTTSNILTRAYDAAVCRGAVRIEMGEALFLAWPTMAFILIAGIILCCQCPGSQSCVPKEDKCDYRPPRDQELVIMRSVPDDRPNCTSRAQYI